MNWNDGAAADDEWRRQTAAVLLVKRTPVGWLEDPAFRDFARLPDGAHQCAENLFGARTKGAGEVAGRLPRIAEVSENTATVEDDEFVKTREDLGRGLVNGGEYECSAGGELAEQGDH